MKINYPKIIFLNLIIAILVYIFFNNDTIVSARGVIFLGFVLPFFFKENLLGRFLLLYINPLFFFLLSILVAYSGQIIVDIMGKGNSVNLSSSVLVFFSFGNMMFYSYGYIIGLLFQVIYERLRGKGNLLENQVRD